MKTRIIVILLTLSGIFTSARAQDAAADSIVNPQPGEVMPYGISWQPSALFESVGGTNLSHVGAQVQIHRCSDGALVFLTDTTIANLPSGQLVLQLFSSSLVPYDIAGLPCGCYYIEAIAEAVGDINHSNDTSMQTTFSICESGVNMSDPPPSSSEISVQPNPSSGQTTLRFTVENSLPVKVSIVNLLGVEVATLFSGELDAGDHSFEWDASGVPAGMYECVVRAGGEVQRIPILHY
jgi:hypothetical protein